MNPSVITPLLVMLAITIFWSVEQTHLPASTGITGLNAYNIVLGITILIVLVNRQRNVPAPPLLKPIALFFLALLWGFLIGVFTDSSAFVDDLIVLKTGIVYISLFFVFYYGANSIESVRLLWVVVMGVAILAGLEIMREAVDYGIGSYSESKRAAGPFGADYRGANLAAIYVAIMIPVFASVIFFLRKQPFVRLVAVGGFLLLIMALFFTYSRQAYAIAAVTLLLLAMRKNVILGLLVSLVLLNYEVWAPSSVLDRVNETTAQTDELGNQQFDESTSSRWELWAGAAKMFAERPQGIGLNHFKRNVHRYTRYRNLDAHNFYVLITAEAGLLGAIAIVLLAGALIRFAVLCVKRADTAEEKAMTMGFLGATIALLMGNLFGSRFLNGEVVASYWVMAGLCARYFALANAQTPRVAQAEEAHSMSNLEIRQARAAREKRRRLPVTASRRRNPT